MAETKKSTRTRKKKPAATPEARENQLIALAMDRAEEQLREGTASTQLISHFLKLGSTRESAEKQMLREKTKLITAQVETLESQKRVEELYQEAIDAIRTYNGDLNYEYDDDED